LNLLLQSILNDLHTLSTRTSPVGPSNFRCLSIRLSNIIRCLGAPLCKTKFLRNQHPCLGASLARFSIYSRDTRNH
jgi:hypothetical protein